MEEKDQYDVINWLIVFAFRYAQPRHSCAMSTVLDCLKRSRGHITISNLENMLKDIDEPFLENDDPIDIGVIADVRKEIVFQIESIKKNKK